MASKANLNIVLALLQDIKNNPSDKAGSTAAIAEANIKRDGLDRGDIHEIAANSVLDQIGDPSQKIAFTLGQHPELIDDISDWAEMDKNEMSQLLNSGRLDIISDLFEDYLTSNGVKIFGQGGQFESDLDVINVKIGEKTYKLLYLYSEEEKEKGLMDVEDMDDDEGAIFDYSDNPKNRISFWMKNTTIALRILFINKDGVVISAHNGEPLSEESITEASEPVYWVIELNQSEQVPQGTYTNLALRDEPDAEPEDDDESEEDEHPEIKLNKLYIYDGEGNVQAEIDSGCRIFSRKSTKTIIRKAKRAYLFKLDKDYKSLGRYVFNEIKAQDNRDPEYVEN